MSADEDKMIFKLMVHRELVGWTIEKLQAEGISARRTTGNDPRGDIRLERDEDTPKVRQLIARLQKKYNPT